MRKLFRTAAYFVLITFVLSLGDWPFVDEILAEQIQIQQDAFAALQASPSASTVTKTSNVSHSAASIYESLVNLIDMPRHAVPSMLAQRATGYLAETPRFVSAMPDPFERPPSFSLS